jgi:CheY-like chemotaxis protein
MRPKKVILIVDDNEQELSVMSYLLDIHGYCVMPMASGDEALMIFSGTLARGGVIDLVIADFAMPQMNGSQLIARLKQIASHIPMILLGDPKAYAGQIHSADALLSKRLTTPEELLQRIKIMSARKRGPRKGVLRAPVPAEIETGA